jgi:hypothetical protein
MHRRLPTASAKSFPPYGASGDASFRDTCPKGEYLVGLQVRSGAWLDQLAISCHSLTGKGGLHHGPAHGGEGGGPSEVRCPAGYIIRNMNFTMTSGNRQAVTL